MTIFSLLDEATVFPRLEAENKQEILDHLIESLRTTASGDEIKRIRQAVLEREKIMSTGVGKGLAIPHGKAEGIEGNYAAFAVLKEPVEYNAIDNQPVRIVFLLVGPQSSNSFHIKMLSRISRLMNNSDFRERLLECETAAEIIDVFKQEEHAYFDS
ncbi:MAG: PTS sugar transporter subunit IIA [Balneolaceae bacterium]|nr:PTS sugar transporter subunit IIA [Balneolaceae bacterium]